MKYTHKPTSPGDSRSNSERSVNCDGVCIGRIHRFNYGPTKGKWWWTLEWMVSNNSGVCDTMEEALKVIKFRHQNAK
jgi:hypothetical protein